MKITLPPEKRQAAAHCFENGLGYKRTASLIGVTESTVRDWKRLWKANHFTLAPQFQYKGKLSVEEQKRILELRLNGQNIGAIAKDLKRSSNMVARFLHKTMTSAALSTVR